jgi:VWFA-related protein
LRSAHGTFAQEGVRLKADLVELRAVVIDQHGKPVTTLTKDDFEVFENAKPRALDFFSVERVTGQARSEGSQPLPGRAASRSIVLFVDTLHLAPSSYLRVKQMLRKFITEQVTENDLVAIVTSSGAMGLFNQFTRDRRLLLYAVERIAPGREGVSTSRLTPYVAALVESGDEEALALAVAALEAEEGPLASFNDHRAADAYAHNRARVILMEAHRWRKIGLSTLEAAATQMAEMPGQRLIFYISDGFSLRGNGALDTVDLNRATSRAVRSGVIIYTFSAKGLDTDRTVGDLSVGAITLPGFQSFASASVADLENSLNALARETGGEAILRTNDLAGAMNAALRSNAVYYTLSYYQTIEKNSNQLRKVSVRVKGHPEYTVRAQKGYLPADSNTTADAKGPQERVLNAIVASVPLADIGVAASAYFMDGEADGARVSLEAFIDGSALKYSEQDQRHHVEVDVTTIVFDQSGRAVRRITDTVRGNLSPDRAERARLKGLRYAKLLVLDPGAYQIRVAVRDPRSERIGTAMALVEVPNLHRGKLALSSILLTERLSKETESDAVKNDAFLHNLRLGIPFFRRGNFLVYSLLIFNAAARATAQNGLFIQSEILEGDRSVYQSPWQPVSSRLTNTEGKGVEVGGQINLDLKPGLYEFRITIRGSGSKRLAQQSTLFDVE